MEINNEYDTITCADKQDAFDVIDNLGGENVIDWEFLEDGKIRLIVEKLKGE